MQYKQMERRRLARIPLLAPAKRILSKYEKANTPTANDRLLPVLSNQKMNAYLKEIADACGLSSALTFHLARHTFATTIIPTNGVPIEIVARMPEHKDIRTTQLYVSVIDKKLWMICRIPPNSFI